jgi:hypothetical protein
MKRILVLLGISLVILFRVSIADARVCTYSLAVGPGAFWIETVGNQTVNFKYFGGVNNIRLWSSSQSKVYEGSPVDSFNAQGLLAIEAQAPGYASIEITTDWSRDLGAGCK